MRKEILSSKAPEPIGPYSQAIMAGDFLFISGQIAIDTETGEFINGEVETQAKIVLQNIDNILKEAGLTFNNVVKTTIYLKSIKDFPAVNAVYETFVTRPFPARSTVEVSSLPKGALIEIDAIAHVKL